MPGGEGGAPMPVSDTSNADRLSAILQSPWNKMNQTLTRILPFVIQLKYQGGIGSAFNLHHTILSSYFIVAAIYGFACLCCGGHILPLPSLMDDCCLPVLNATVILTGSLTTTLLLMAIELVFGWVVFVIWVMVCVKMTWGVRAQIYALLRLAIVNGGSLLSSFFQADRILPA